jgi:hypothetical protein
MDLREIGFELGLVRVRAWSSMNAVITLPALRRNKYLRQLNNNKLVSYWDDGWMNC